uniref:Kinesin-like protein KIF11 n=1 Tax=Cacopsylla melanoneura TaxID=428564 RepID=A0A8D9EXZ5_9HEMI
MMESATKAKPACKESKERNIQVFVRVRPLNSVERAAKSCSIVDCSSSREITIKERVNDKISKTFGFDRVFSQESKQVDVYKYVVNPLIDEVLSGYNCTVFAYGQTGTGKTFTMEGEKSNDPSISWQDDPLSGIVPRAMNHLFDELRLLGDAEFTVRVSFLEIYNEELIDLLSPTDDITKLRLFEDSARKGSVIIQGLEEKAVHNKDEVYKILEKGSQKRQTAATLMNAHSSRSHTIFTITIHIKDNSMDGEELLRTGKLNLVDLAGSENIGRSGAQDKRAREAGNINQSLLTLGRCITALVEKTPHIPYRESKLTRLLQDSLGGRTKTSIIATISPAQLNMEETLSTLDYAHRAKNITNRPEINQKMSKKALLREYTEEIEKLRRDLVAAREKNGVFLAAENYDQMVNELEYLRNELTTKINNIKAIVEQKESLEKVMDDLKISTTLEIEQKTQQLQTAKEKILDVEYDKKEQEFLVSKQKETEERLSQQALQVKNVVEEATYDLTKLQSTLERVRKLEKCNATNVRELGDKVAKSASFFVNFSLDHSDEVAQSIGKLKKLKEETNVQENKFVENIQGQVSGLDNLVDNIVSCTGQTLAHTKSEHETLVQDSLSKLKNNCTMYNEFCVKMIGQLNTVCTSMLENEVFQFEHNQTSLETKLKECKTKLLSMQSDCALIEAALNENKVETVRQVEDIETILKQIAEEDKQLDKFDDEKDELIDQMVKRYQSLAAEQREAKTRVRTNMAAVKNQFEELKVGVGSRNEKLMQFLQDDTAKKTEDIITHMSDIENETHSQTMQAVDKVKDKVEELNLNFTGAIEESKEILESQTCDSEQQCSKFMSSINTHVDELSKLTIEGIGTGVKGRTTVLRDCVQTHMTRFNTESNTTDQAIAATENQVQDLTRVLQNQHKCDEIVSSFVQSQYLADTPSGETPPRKEFKYPARFAATSPHERLIQKFRLTVPRTHFTLDEETEDATPLTSTSEVDSESDASLPKPRRSSSLNDLNNLPPSAGSSSKDSISPASSEIIVRKPGQNRRKNQKENTISYKKVAGAANGKIPIAKTKSGDNIVRANNNNNRGILAEKN